MVLNELVPNRIVRRLGNTAVPPPSHPPADQLSGQIACSCCAQIAVRIPQFYGWAFDLITIFAESGPYVNQIWSTDAWGAAGAQARLPANGWNDAFPRALS